MARSNWQSHGDDFKRGIGKLNNKQTNTRMSFYERSPGNFKERGEPWDSTIPDFDIPDFKDESHPPECRPCDPNISDDPYEESLPTNAGEKSGRVRNYSDYQMERYGSQGLRFQRSLNLRLRGFDSAIDLDGNITYKFCSKRSPSNYWTVTKKAATRVQVELMCWEEFGGGYRGKALKFNGGYGKPQSIKVVNDISPSPNLGLIQVHTWNTAPNLSLMGRLWYRDISLFGETFEFTPLEFGSKYLSFFARNPAHGYYDGLFFEVVEGEQTIRLLGW